MRYKSFKIQNFKGIKDTVISLEGIAGASVFAFVGLNESGKTTILEAIHSFSPDSETSRLIGDEEGIGVPVKNRVPRHMIASFTGRITVTATLTISSEDKEKICAQTKAEAGLLIEALPDELEIESADEFSNGDFVDSTFEVKTDLRVKKSRQQWRNITKEERGKIASAIYALMPDIAYFPTFVFDFPEKAFICGRNEVLDRFYKRVFQDILDSDGRGHSIEKDIIRRVRAEPLQVAWLDFLTKWGNRDDHEKIQQVMDRASAAVTKVVFGRWNQIFREETRGKEVVISHNLAEGEIRDRSGIMRKTNKHDVYIRFQIKDGTRRFNINDRSLGFRWFFAFMLFTQFRVTRASSRPILFLFDEPASNLHAAAQQKLIESFPQIAQGAHTLAYTTHSHYMVEPKWLEQTYIVTNREDTPSSSILDGASLDDESLDVKATSYRSFAEMHPNKTSYFQPIVDRLQIVPSNFDIKKSSIILEGKSDYYILRYAIKLQQKEDISLIPGLGAGTLSALAALHVGWNLQFLFLLDADTQGKIEKERYARDYGIPTKRLATLADIVSNLKVIEDLLDEEALKKIANNLNDKDSKANCRPNKSQIRRFFQERLASDNVISLGDGFKRASSALIDGLASRVKS